MDKSKLHHFQQKLEQQRAELQDLSESAEESRSAVELDQTRQGRLSRMDALQQQQMALATEERRKTQLKRIDSALVRIKSGDYGYCVMCDEEIDEKRLEFDPAIPTCINCARA